MDTTTEEPTRRQGPRWRYVIAAMVATMALTSGMTAYAAHLFDDVPGTNPFHSDVTWLAGTGITSGCGGNNFCPNNPVTRAQMARFMKSFYNLQAGLVDVKSVQNSSGATTNSPEQWTTAADLGTSVVIPPGTQAELHMSLNAEAFCEGGSNTLVVIVVAAPSCNVRFLVNNSSSGVTPSSQTLLESDLTQDQIDNSTAPDLLLQSRSASAEASTGLLGPGTYNVTVQMFADSGSGTRALTFDLNESTVRTEVLLADA